MDESDSNGRSPTTLPIFTVDAFTSRAFAGNPAAVCPLTSLQVISDEVKQKIAAEMNLSETAFLSPNDGGSFETGRRFSLRWFTPKCEVPLCGHATVASSAVLFWAYGNKSSSIEFETASGVLKAKQLPGKRIEIDLPTYEPTPADNNKYKDVIKAAVGSLPVHEVVLSESGKLLIRLRDDVTRRQMQKVKPREIELLSGAPDLQGVIVTLRGSEECVDESGRAYDFVSRYFAPWMGILEDPVTGSAHSVLTPYWSKVLKKNELYSQQCSPRGGDLGLRLTDGRVAISGGAAIVIRGQISF